MDKVIKNKRDLELVTSRSSGYEISSQKFLYWLYQRDIRGISLVIYYLTKFDVVIQSD